jgi:hypothetical protein
MSLSTVRVVASGAILQHKVGMPSKIVSLSLVAVTMDY